MKRDALSRFKHGFHLFLLSLFVFSFAQAASAQRRFPTEQVSGKLISMKVSEVTLESINFRDQTARLSVGLDISNRLIPVSLKDFDYRLSLFDQEMISGNYDGTIRISGREASRVNLPVTVNLRSIPGVLWNAFSNRGQVRYTLDTGFTLPLYVFEQRFDKSFSGEVPLRTLVDAASILRARSLSDGGSSYGRLPIRW